jgi:putative transposase
MTTTRRITFKLYPGKQAEQNLHYARKAHCDLYNAALSHRKTQYKRFGVSINYFDQQNNLPDFKEELPEYKEFGSHTLQATLKRVDFAFQRFFKGLAKHPKFNSKLNGSTVVGLILVVQVGKYILTFAPAKESTVISNLKI